MSTAHPAAHETAQRFTEKNLPRRVRQLLAGIFDQAAPAFERMLNSGLDDFEQQLFKQAEQGTSSLEEARWIEAQNLVRRRRDAMIPLLRQALVAELAGLRDPGTAGTLSDAGDGIGVSTELSLATQLDADETSVVSDMSHRVEMRNNLPLYLLGQRLAVLAAKPGLASEAIPIGPQAFCRMLRDASQCLGLTPDLRRAFFKSAERQMMIAYGDLVGAANTYLVKNLILPDFEYMPTRVRQKSPQETGSLKADPHRHVQDRTIAAGIDSPWYDPTDAAHPPASTKAAVADLHPPGTPESEEAESFAQMRQLLARRNQLLAKLKPAASDGAPRSEPIATQALQDSLRILQRSPAAPGTGADTTRSGTRGIQQVKQELLARMHARPGGQRLSALNDEDNDVFDLVDMLFDSIQKETMLDSLAAQLLEKLQVPLLRVALQDKGFFYQREHPAKQLLDAIAESGAYWLGDDKPDPALLDKMHAVVDRTVREFDGDMSLFNQLSNDINSHLQLLTHKADVAERRHVEAARGKEKLAQARDQATAAVGAALATAPLPPFTKAVLSEAWTDVLALTALRQGEGGAAWQHQLNVLSRLIRSAQGAAAKQRPGPDEVAALRKELGDSLVLVGYQDDEIEAIAERLVDPQHEQAADTGKQAELAKRMESRAHFGVDENASRQSEAPLDEEEERRYEELKGVAFGTWFEFASGNKGEPVRHRLAWFSTTSGHTLFVNKRGQRVGDHSLASLARLMARKELSVVKEKPGGIIDRAWRSVMAGLRSFAGQASAGVTK